MTRIRKGTEAQRVENRAPLVLLLGVWIGGSVAVVGVVGYSFPGVERSLESNEKLRARAGFEAGDVAKKKTSPLWVLVGELNRHYFRGFNAAQLVLAAATLVLAALSRRRSVLILVTVAVAITAVLAFHLAGEITERGRELDFLPRDPPPRQEADFLELHRVYTGLEAAKTLLLVGAALLTVRRPRGENA